LPAGWFQHFDRWAEDEHVGEQRDLDDWAMLMEQQGVELIITKWTFNVFGRAAWELDRVSDNHPLAKTMLMPVCKLLAKLEGLVPVKPGTGNILLLGARK
jgi:hypothetical protein